MDEIQKAIVEFVGEHALLLGLGTVWYFVAGFMAALLGRRTRIDAWCNENPKRALAFHLLRATGFDFWKTVASIRDFSRARAGLPPAIPFGADDEGRKMRGTGISSIVFVVFLAVVGTGPIGCGRAAIDAEIDRVLLVEQKLESQIDYIDTLFNAVILAPGITPEKRKEFMDRYADAKSWLSDCLEAKDAALLAAKEANAETVDLTKLSDAIANAMGKLISVLAFAGANPNVVHEQHVRAMATARGLR